MSQNIDDVNKIFEQYAEKIKDGLPQVMHNNKEFIIKLRNWLMFAQNETQVEAAIQLAFIKGYETANSEEPLDYCWNDILGAI